jgi:hypothetical protein
MTAEGRGLYEVLVTGAIESRLRVLDARLQARKDSLRSADAADRIALHVARIIQRTVASVFPFLAGSTIASRPSSASGTRSTSTDCRPSSTLGSTTDSISVTFPGTVDVVTT